MNDKELFYEIEKHLLEDEKPSVFLEDLKESGNLKKSFLSILEDLEKVQQEKKYHPEGNVWIHSMQVVDEAANLRNKANNKREFMWAALLHDIGKKETTKMRKGRWTAYEHDKAGAERSYVLLKKVVEDERFISDVKNLIKYHMSYLYIVKNLPFVKPEDIILDSDIYDVALLTYCDRVGRGEKTLVEKREIIRSINKFIEKINSITNKHYKILNILKNN